MMAFFFVGGELVGGAPRRLSKVSADTVDAAAAASARISHVSLLVIIAVARKVHV